MEWYRKAAAAGNGRAIYSIGLLYTQGQGVPQDYAKAVQWFRNAACGAAGNAGIISRLKLKGGR